MQKRAKILEQIFLHKNFSCIANLVFYSSAQALRFLAQKWINLTLQGRLKNYKSKIIGFSVIYP